MCFADTESCRHFELTHRPDTAKLYGELCATIPRRYAVGQGFCEDKLRFGVETGKTVELQLEGNAPCDCRIAYQTHSGTGSSVTDDKKVEEIYFTLFQELVQRIVQSDS